MTVEGTNSGHQSSVQHWIHWLVNLAIAVGAGIFVIPFVRSRPAVIHEFVLGLAAWQRHLFIFLACVLFAQAMFKLFSPRLRHLKHFSRHPPTWLAWLTGGISLAVIDIVVGLSPGGYTASGWEWAGYGLGALVLVSLYRRHTTPGDAPQQVREERPSSHKRSPVNDWEAIEAWLQSDSPAEHDFLDHHGVAERLKAMLASGTRSVAIVGPFGAGKTSIIKWLGDLVRTDPGIQNGLLVSEHSCWGFETSASSIHAMLVSAIGKVREHIDTFQVSSLPESYRQTFSAAGEWFDSVSKLLLGNRDPLEQFHDLSALLGDMKSRLVFVVEDLDRNDSRSFDIQEVLAFLQPLKECPHLSFVLTGGLNAPNRIDFAKLCDHIEYLRPISAQQSGGLVASLRQRCLDDAVFPHHRLTDPDDNQWSPTRWMLLSDRDEVWPPEAIARLLNTPRALRHALGRTYRAWQTLYGEVDWDHLLALNVLRFAAPQALSFVLRHWKRLNDRPSQSSHQHGQIDKIRASLRRDLDAIVRDVEWDARAARTLIDLILPATPVWLDDDGHGDEPRPQGLHLDRCWQRALTESIPPDQIRDQVVIRDIDDWLKSPSSNSALVSALRRSEDYSNVWEHLARHFLRNDSDRILLLCQHVLDRVWAEDGAHASSDSQGFVAVWRYANRFLERTASNRQWLEDRITEAASTSLQLVDDLWHYWGSGSSSILRREDSDAVRAHVIATLQNTLVNVDVLNRVLDGRNPYILYHLVFDPANDERTRVEIDSWRWLASVLYEALRREDVTVAVAVCHLIIAQDGRSRGTPSGADRTVLTGFFNDQATEVIEAIERLAPQMNEKDRSFVVEILMSARTVSQTENENDRDQNDLLIPSADRGSSQQRE